MPLVVPTGEGLEAGLDLRQCREIADAIKILPDAAGGVSTNIGWKRSMDHALQQKIISLLDDHRTMRIATVRPDGWPQTTTVGYANEGLTLWFLCAKDSQKAANLARDDRVSLAIDDDVGQVMQIKGLSMAAHAHRVADEAEAAKALGLLFARYPAQEGAIFALPSPADVAIFRVTPTIVSVLDYSLGFVHTDLIACDIAPAASG